VKNLTYGWEVINFLTFPILAAHESHFKYPKSTIPITPAKGNVLGRTKSIVV
jgi:hypothetical protein